MTSLTLTEKSPSNTSPAPAVSDSWAIMAPVRGRIRLAMTLAVAAAVLPST